MLALIRHPTFQRVAISAAWMTASLAYLHLAIDSTRPRSIDLHGWLAVAAVVSFLFGAATVTSHHERLRVVSGLAAALTVVVALALIAARAAHETGVALLVAALAIALLSIPTREPAPGGAAPGRDAES